MKRLLIISILGLSNFFAIAQDQKWSVEANYPLNVSNDTGFNELNGIIDLGIKYRFAELGPIRLGAGLSAAFLKNYDNFTYGNGESNNIEFDYKVKQFLIQPKLFAELAIPGFTKLKPQLALGYSLVVHDSYWKDGENVNFDETNTDGGLNLNVGLSYDITKRFFIQIQYDNIKVNRKGDTVINGESIPYDFKENTGLLKAGVGFRF